MTYAILHEKEAKKLQEAITLFQFKDSHPNSPDALSRQPWIQQIRYIY